MPDDQRDNEPGSVSEQILREMLGDVRCCVMVHRRRRPDLDAEALHHVALVQAVSKQLARLYACLDAADMAADFHKAKRRRMKWLREVDDYNRNQDMNDIKDSPAGVRARQMTLRRSRAHR